MPAILANMAEHAPRGTELTSSAVPVNRAGSARNVKLVSPLYISDKGACYMGSFISAYISSGWTRIYTVHTRMDE